MKSPKSSSRSLTGIFIGAALGAVAMYFLDPQKGRTRRIHAQDKIFKYGRRTRRLGERTADNFRNRVYGKMQEIQHKKKASRVDDYTLEQRVRAAIGRKVSHVKAIKIFVTDGEVVLAGPILNHEVQELIAGIKHIPGVRRVIDELSKYDHAGNVPGLQGEGITYRQ
ncbi:BON domain-containing protein [Bdellovibrio sp. HCB337]|uniref:BON domain-containing protein n=1 Tax=Bdellovibrio sp. HCB337 TaxID=3394358 RepID=UPI0039A55498